MPTFLEQLFGKGVKKPKNPSFLANTFGESVLDAPSPFSGFNAKTDPFLQSQPTMSQDDFDPQNTVDFYTGLASVPLTVGPDLIGIAQQAGNAGLNKTLDLLTGAEGADFTPLGEPLTGDHFRDLIGLDKESGQGIVGESVSPVGTMAKALGVTIKAVTAGAKLAAGTGFDPSLAMTLFHGTPHKFQKFDMAKIGSGEGAQAYGHGLYFAENKGIADGYRSTLSQPKAWADGSEIPYNPSSNSPKDLAIGSVAVKGYDGAIAHTDKMISEGVDSGFVSKIKKEVEGLRGKKIKIDEGHLYEVDIPDNITDKMLDWDAPLSEQPEIVAAMPESIQRRIRMMQDGFGDEKVTGQILHDTIIADEVGAGGFAASEKQSELLREAGIPGIRFLDGGNRNVVNAVADGPVSRFAERLHSENGGDIEKTLDSLMEKYPAFDRAALEKALPDTLKRTRNIVVFNPDDITSVKRDGELVFENKLGAIGLAATTRAANRMTRFTPSPDLSDAQRPIETRFFNQLNDNYDESIAQYNALPSTKNGKIIAVDDIRELDATYRADRSLSASVHEPASVFAKDLWDAKLAEPGTGDIMLMSGGTGAGKSTGLEVIGTEQYHGIFDSNLSNLKKGIGRIDQALETGRNVDIVHVWRDPIEAFSGKGGSAVTRAMRNEGNGRTVPISSHIDTHVGSNKAIKELEEFYKGDDRVNIVVIDNSRGKNNAVPADTSVIRDLDAGALRREIREEADKALKEGRINEKTYQGFVGET